MSKSLTIIQNEEWYEALIQDLKAILTEGIFNYHWTLIKTYHLIGQRIAEEKDKFAGQEIQSLVSNSLGKSEKTIERAIKFYEKYPDLDKLPEGKKISWHRIVNDLLPDKKEEHICNFEPIFICKCGKRKHAE